MWWTLLQGLKGKGDRCLWLGLQLMQRTAASLHSVTVSIQWIRVGQLKSVRFKSLISIVI